ncbi:hypothetical protein FOTG_16266 [Fusarium oxysporum f. sp. vasinfectum 25433]|uniref:Uncharacterized protein n=1 Tax=Fusarium oxysporum f. sp. vasinfectum 25433 TaxID=1089449 RepID=X0KPB9_FUSOX|nr:hypothetical protein FOTG_16266 [Fusarium oxysporum f. sp. vasinfectum 25433]
MTTNSALGGAGSICSFSHGERLPFLSVAVAAL